MSHENNGPVTRVYPCRGGARPGAGRPAGSKNQRSADTARQAAEAGITPIEVMLNAMRELWDQGSAEATKRSRPNCQRRSSLCSPTAEQYPPDCQ